MFLFAPLLIAISSRCQLHYLPQTSVTCSKTYCYQQSRAAKRLLPSHKRTFVAMLSLRDKG